MNRARAGHLPGVPHPPDGICELALASTDVDAMVGFYERVGLGVVGREPGRVWLRAGATARLGIWSAGEKEHRDRGGMHVHFALSVSSEALDTAARELGDSGRELEGPVVHDGGDRSLYVSDPEGNRVELWDVLDGEG